MPARISLLRRPFRSALCLAAALHAAVGAQTPAAPPDPPASRELVLHKWSGQINVPDPVACAVDPQGRVYVVATTRRKVGDLDIREHPMWIPDDVALTRVADKAAFFRRELAPGKLRAPRGMLKDHNLDGSIDWKDLTFHTERIYQLRDTNGDGTADSITIFAEGFNSEVTGIAAGVLYHDGWVYATIAPDLWRFKDTDDDGVADIREVVVHGFGVHIAYAGHDMHGLTVGPDGRIYWSIGDKGLNVTSKEGRSFYYPNEGAVMRIEPDGSNFEVYARGSRNVQEPAFDDFGDLIGVDNDADQPGERERFLHIIEGSDAGWRCNYQYMKEASPWMREGLWKPHFPGQPAYLLPSLASYSDGPAGFKYEPGTALSDAQRGLFLLNEFPSGKMRGFRTERDGATFKMADARILNDGIMGIGMSWHPDGSLMMVDWIGGYPLDGLGALWRVDARGGAANALRRETQVILQAGFAGRADSELLALLAHPDQRVRQGAQLELAKRGKQQELLTAALRNTASIPIPAAAGRPQADRERLQLLARVHAIWGYGQLLRRGGADPAAALPLLRDADSEIRAQTAKILGDAHAVLAAHRDAPAITSALIPLLSDASPRGRLQTALALGKLGPASAVDALFAMAERDGANPALRTAVVSGLAGCASPRQLGAQKANPSVNVRRLSVVALRRQAAPEVAEFLGDSDPLVVDEAARAIHDDLSIPAALPALSVLVDRVPRNEMTMLRAINANLRLGTDDAARRLLDFALDDRPARSLRADALTALRVWNEPPSLDRVDGYARMYQPAPIAGVLTPRLVQLLALSDPGLKTLAIEIMIAHRLRAGAAHIATIVADAGAPGELRAQSLRLMSAEQRSDPAFARALNAALAAEAPAPLHRTALELLLPQDPQRLVAEATTALKTRPVPEQQYAIGLLARVGRRDADAVLSTLGDGLVDGSSPAELKLDIIEALRARSTINTTLAAKLQRYSESPAAAGRSELLAGGEVARGRDIVLNHLAANCMACHAVDGGGGSEVGPNLRTIGEHRDAAYLLEALIAPSAAIPAGYGLVNVTLKDRTEITGTIARETPAAVSVRMFDGTFKTVNRADIASQTPPISIMPSMEGILQPRELRDVVAYLSSLRGGRARAPNRDAGP
jgi:quinoprotein glucose dehydrogenase